MGICPGSYRDGFDRRSLSLALQTPHEHLLGPLRRLQVVLMEHAKEAYDLLVALLVFQRLDAPR